MASLLSGLYKAFSVLAKVGRALIAVEQGKTHKVGVPGYRCIRRRDGRCARSVFGMRRRRPMGLLSPGWSMTIGLPL
jgi:hypothetical protein